MVGLLDIAPQTAFVDVGGQRVSVPGVSIQGVATLITRFPDLRSLLSGMQVDAARLLGMGGEIAAAIGAAGCGYPGDAKAEASFAALNLNAQAALLEAILKQTLPDGVGPFVDTLTRMGALLNFAGGEQKPAASPVKLRAMTSRLASNS